LDYWKYLEILERNKQGFCNPPHRIIEDVYTIEIEDQTAIEPWVRLLVERGWEVDSRNRYMRTPLMLAVESWNAGLVRILLEARADGG
jgi:ankyrin repeat protein